MSKNLNTLQKKTNLVFLPGGRENPLTLKKFQRTQREKVHILYHTTYLRRSRILYIEYCKLTRYILLNIIIRIVITLARAIIFFRPTRVGTGDVSTIRR